MLTGGGSSRTVLKGTERVALPRRARLPVDRGLGRGVAIGLAGSAILWILIIALMRAMLGI